MSNKLEKFLAKLSGSQYDAVLVTIDKIILDDLNQIDCKPLKVKKGYFRVRVGRVRIIFAKFDNAAEIMHVSFRDEQTYRDF